MTDQEDETPTVDDTSTEAVAAEPEGGASTDEVEDDAMTDEASTTEIVALFKTAKAAGVTATSSRKQANSDLYKALGEAYLWLKAAKTNEKYQKNMQQKNGKQKKDDQDADWLTYSLAQIFGLTGEQKSTLSKYKAVFGKFDKKDWSEELTAALVPEVTADILGKHIDSSGGIEKLAKSDITVKRDGALEKGKAFFSEMTVLGTASKAVSELELDPAENNTGYISVLCRVNGNDLEVLELGGYVKAETLENKGHSLIVEEEQTIEPDVLFWKNVCVAYAALKAKNPVVSLQEDGKTIWISNADNAVGSATADYTSDHQWSNFGKRLVIKGTMLNAISKLMSTPQKQRDAKISIYNESRKVVFVVGEEAVELELSEEIAQKQWMPKEVDEETKSVSGKFVWPTKKANKAEYDRMSLDPQTYFQKFVKDTFEQGAEPGFEIKDVQAVLKVMKSVDEINILATNDIVNFVSSYGTVTIPRRKADMSVSTEGLMAAG